MSAVKYVGLGLAIASFLILGYAIYAYVFKMSESIRKKQGRYMIRIIIEAVVFAFFGTILFIYG